MNKNLSDTFYASLQSQFEKGGQQDDALAFARKLFKLAALDELIDEPVADLCGLVRSLRSYLEVFPPGAGPKLRSFNPGLDEDGWEHKFTQVFILQTDMAFLVDSVRMALTRLGMGIQRINSTVIDLVRDGDGNLLRWLEQGSRESHREALIYFQLDHYISPQQHRAVEAEIRGVLDEVGAVNGDYQPSIARLEAATEGLRRLEAGKGQQGCQDSIAFLEWLKDNHFTFLAYSYYNLSAEEDPLISLDSEKCLGLFRHRRATISPRHVSTLAPGVREFHAGREYIALAKSGMRSRVHRDAYCDYVIVKDFDADGKTIGEHRFLGLYTSLVYFQSPFGVPMIGDKLERIFQRSGLNPAGHYGKTLRQIMEVHPREELFTVSEQQLYDTLIGIWQINERRRVRLFVSPDPYEKFINCMVYFPRDTYRTDVREKAQRLLMDALQATECQFSTFFTQSLLVRTHFVMKICSTHYRDMDVAGLERQIAAFARDWRDDLHRAIIEHWGDERGITLSGMYRDAFPVSYQSHFDPRSAVQDIALCHDLANEGQIETSFFQPPGAEPGIMRLKIFHPGAELSLSRMVPLLENLGFEVISEHPYAITPQGRDPLWINDFTLRFSLGIPIDVPGVRQNFIDAFKAVWQGKTGDDSFNGLVIGARLDWRAVALLRLYARYMKQLGIAISQEFIAATLVANIEITRNLVALFKSSFDPRLAPAEGEGGDRGERCKRLEARILEALDGVRNLNQDQVLRTYLQMICATLRTNFFQRGGNGEPRSAIAIKLSPRELPLVPEPRPEFEIFVSSPRFEGVHLRAGKVARGGIRWSDRQEDYRTEILGLVKAQQVKNAVIVPTGAKGGFVVRTPMAGLAREVILAEGRACYQLFMGALLDLTDNIRAGDVVPPADVVRRDGDDPYLVVAADKGTASFSDLANSVAEEYGHWLGDAFASGGSHGYDHKKMGITARGAWIAVERHFRELGVNIRQENFSVVGIGDMSGDVFGNGMLLSPHIRLLAAFNHNAIFIDPNPDPQAAFAERKRLFESGSNWFDYSPGLISAGGGVFSRDLKVIRLSAEAREALAIVEAELTPARLIRHLLQAPVDLIWNGGIGTYVKSRGESHGDVGDRANDELRVDGRELRCRVFGEGGNLGMTQKGRIEFCLKGGACNTDFIDNSAGVDCSDHEVNIKIALNRLVADEDITWKQRNALLESMAGEVAGKVLEHNYRQTQALSLATLRARSNPSEFWHCIQDWESAGVLNRGLENLPDDDMLADREKNGQFLTRPELAVLLSYSKMQFKQQLQQSAVDGDAFIFREIFQAFPASLASAYAAALENHALRREVLCTQLANEIIDVMGLTFVHRQMKATGASALEVARSYIIAREVFDMERVWREVEGMDARIPAQTQANLLLNLMRLGRRTTRWLLRNRRHCADTQREINTLKPILQDLLKTSLGEERPDQGQAREDIPELFALGLKDYSAMLIDSASDLYFALGMADACIRAGAGMELVTTAYAFLGDTLQLEWFSGQIIELATTNRWEDFARESSMDELEGQFRRLAVLMLDGVEGAGELEQRIDRWRGEESVLILRWQEMIREIRASKEKRFAMFSVALRQLGDLVEATATRAKQSESGEALAGPTPCGA